MRAARSGEESGDTEGATVAAHGLRAAVPSANDELWADPTIHQPTHVEPSPDPASELAAVLTDAVRACVITPDDAHLIAQTRIAGHRVQDLAQGSTARPRTLWDRRQRAEQALTTQAQTALSVGQGMAVSGGWA